jgi:hypothetical protein
MLNDIKKVQNYFSNPCNDNNCVIFKNMKLSDFLESKTKCSNSNLSENFQNWILKYINSNAFVHYLTDILELKINSKEFNEHIYWFIKNKTYDDIENNDDPILDIDYNLLKSDDEDH